VSLAPSISAASSSASARPLGKGDCRCACGSLLARLVEGAVELKCRRCKRTVRVPLAGPVEVELSEARGIEPRAQRAGGAVAPAPRQDAGPCLSCCCSSDS